MIYVVLLGGQATRLLPLTYTTPKALVPVLNRPYLEGLLRRLEAEGATRVVLASGHLARDVEAFVQAIRGRLGCELVTSVEPEPLGSGGALRFARPHLDERTFVLLNGDIVTDIRYRDLIEAHRATGAEVTVAVAPVEDRSRFGILETAADGRATAWLEKPGPGQTASNLANIGIWIMQPSIIEAIAPGRFVSLEKDVFPRFIESGRRLFAYRTEARWVDIGTIATYLEVQFAGLKGELPIDVPGEERDPGVWVEAGAKLADPAGVEAPALIGANAEIGPSARLRGPVVVGEGCRVGEGAEVSRSVVWAGTRLGAGARVEDSFLGADVTVGEGAVLRRCVIASGSRVPGGRELSGVVLGPGSDLGR